MVSPDPLSPTPSMSSAMKTPKNTEEDPDDPESAGEENIQMKYSLDYLYSLKIATVTENHL